MNPPAPWGWRIQQGAIVLTGSVQAVDPRDALSRALCTGFTQDRLVGEALGVPLEVLYHAPANASVSYDVVVDGVSIAVWLDDAQPSLSPTH